MLKGFYFNDLLKSTLKNIFEGLQWIFNIGKQIFFTH